MWAAEFIEVVLSRVVLLGETVSIKIVREAELPSDFEIVDFELVYCTRTIYHRWACWSSGLSQKSKIFHAARRGSGERKRAQRKNSP